VIAVSFPRPVPLIGDATSAAERAAAPDAWAFDPDARSTLYDVIDARRDVRRFRPDPVEPALLDRVLTAGHHAPSVGHSQPWRFVVVRDASIREKAAWMADQQRLAQAALLEPSAARHLLDLQLEGIREAPLGVVVCCDRRTPAAGVLGRATFPDADLWSCACAIQNLWLAARAEGLGMGWVTLFDPDELAGLLRLPEGVVTLGWLCLGWPDERPPAPGLERAGWSKRAPLEEVVLHDQWSETAPPVSKLRAPAPLAVVAARDVQDTLLTPPGSLGVLDRAIDRVVALGHDELRTGLLVLAGGAHPVVELGVSAFSASVTDDVLAAAAEGSALGTVAAAAAGLSHVVVDCGSSTGDLLHTDAMREADVTALVERGRAIGAGAPGLVALGEVGIGNTTVAAALAAHLVPLPADEAVGLGSGADTAMLARKREVVRGALARTSPTSTVGALAAFGGPEVALLTGVVLGAAAAGSVVDLDGLLTSVAALCAVLMEPAAAQHLVAGQRSRELAHAAVLERLGLEPLLDLRMRAGEGAGACFAAGMLLSGLRVRRETARTAASASS
jgi:nicotinate-nucleotide--dimethylbenzimidazole phosphoribosyltransferase